MLLTCRADQFRLLVCDECGGVMSDEHRPDPTAGCDVCRLQEAVRRLESSASPTAPPERTDRA